MKGVVALRMRKGKLAWTVGLGAFLEPMDKQIGRAGQAVGHFPYGQIILLEAVNEATNEATSEFVA